MGRKKNSHYPELPQMLNEYANIRNLDYSKYSVYHMRLMDGGYTVLDAWTTGRYWVMTTDYLEMVGKGHIERAGEKGWLPLDKKQLNSFLDKLFFPEEAQ